MLATLSLPAVDALSPRRVAAQQQPPSLPSGTTIVKLMTLNAFNRMIHETGVPGTTLGLRHAGQFSSVARLPQRAIKDAGTLTGPFDIWFTTSSDSSLSTLADAHFTIGNGSISSINKHDPHFLNGPDPYWTATITPDANVTSVTIQLDGDPASHPFKIDSSAPKVRWAGFSSAGGRQNNHNVAEGGHIDLSVQFSENVTVVGSPTVTIVAKTDGTTKQAVYQSGSGTSELIFRYTVEAGLYDPADSQRVAHQYTSTSITLPTGASIKDASNNDATLTLPPRVKRTYNWNPLPTSPTRSSAKPVRDGAVYQMYVQFTEPVVVTGTPRVLWLFRDATVRDARPRRVDYVSGSDTDTLLFRYTLSSAAGLDPQWQESGSALWFYDDSAIRSAANGLDVHYKLASQVVTQIHTVTEGQTHYLGQSLECCEAWPPSPQYSYVQTRISAPFPLITVTNGEMRWRTECRVATDPAYEPDCMVVPYTTTHYATLTVGTDPDSENTWTTIEYDWSSGTDTQYKIWWPPYSRELVVLESRTPPPIFGGGGGVAPVAPVAPVRPAVDFGLDRGRGIRSLHADNAAPSGIWSDGERLWVLDATAGRVFAYALADGDGRRQPGLEIELDAGNAAPVSMSSDGETVWVLDSVANRLFAYSLADGGRLPARDVALEGRFGSPRAIWSGGGSHYVVSNPLAVYDLATGALAGTWALDWLNRSPAGAWSDGTTLWISNSRRTKIFAYRLPRPEGTEPGESGPAGEAGQLVRVRDEEFNLLPTVGNNSPAGLWSDGETMYVADSDDSRIYAYNMPDAIDARLASLSLTGVDIGDFSPTVADYSGVAAAGVRRTTVKAEAAQPGAEVAIAPADVAGTWGHQARVFDGAGVAVTVTSPDGSRSRVYRVQISAPPQGHFTDDEGSVHAGAIDAVAEAGIMAGCNPPDSDRFCPDRPVTRAETATFLARAFELAPAERPAGFTDVDPQGVHAADIDALYAAGITSGCVARPLRFCGDWPVTRAQMAFFLARALDLPVP